MAQLTRQVWQHAYSDWHEAGHAGSCRATHQGGNGGGVMHIVRCAPSSSWTPLRMSRCGAGFGAALCSFGKVPPLLEMSSSSSSSSSSSPAHASSRQSPRKVGRAGRGGPDLLCQQAWPAKLIQPAAPWVMAAATSLTSKLSENACEDSFRMCFCSQ
jgi:hypothetical protein